ncbi:hypothetical protein [Sphingomonas sp. CCH5-D11]|uniref:hypothetical protein n=1 Tax=Sphingomonas sp. CCH5-D11 TaxID=1768786 RepID=UPI0008295345|nr:hypothetical protein [Sphingomonas sp. CCH5-D11]
MMRRSTGISGLAVAVLAAAPVVAEQTVVAAPATMTVEAGLVAAQGHPGGGHRPGGRPGGGHARPSRPGGGQHSRPPSRPNNRPPVRGHSHTNINHHNNVNVNVHHDYHHSHYDHHHDWDDDWDDHWHPLRTATTVALTAAVVGSIVRSLPPDCSTMVVNGISYSQCGNTWYQPQYAGSSVQYVVVNPPR